MTLMTTLATALTGTRHRLNIAVEGAQDNGLKVLVTADLGATPDSASDAEVRLRAALCRPLVLTGQAQDIEASLVERLSQQVRALDEGNNLLDEIRQLGDEARAAAAAKSKAKATKPAAAAAPDDEQDEQDDEPAADAGDAPGIGDIDDLASAF